MKKALTFIVLALLAVCIFFIIVGSYKAAIMQDIADNSMELRTDSSAISNLEAKLYEIAYSLPIGAEKCGLWLEALLSRKFETFSSQSQLLDPALAEKLAGWPIEKTMEIDLSGSDTGAETMLLLGELPAAEWIDLSRTKVDSKTLLQLLERAPQLQKLQLNETSIKWNPALVDALIGHPNLLKVEVDSSALGVEESTRLKDGLGQ